MKNLVMVVGIAVLAVAGWRWHSSADVALKGSQLVTDRLWIDHLPKDAREKFDVFAVVTREKLCFFENRSRWQMAMDVCRYQLVGGELRTVFPQTETNEIYKVAAAPCSTNGFDYCLEMSGGTHGARKYYSMKSWVIRTGSPGPIDAQIDSITP